MFEIAKEKWEETRKNTKACKKLVQEKEEQLQVARQPLEYVPLTCHSRTRRPWLLAIRATHVAALARCTAEALRTHSLSPSVTGACYGYILSSLL